MPVCLHVSMRVQQAPCVLHNENLLEISPVWTYLCLRLHLCWPALDVWQVKPPPGPAGSTCSPRWQVMLRGPTVAIGNGRTGAKDFFLGAIWKTMGEHLVPQGYWHLSAPVHWHKRQHVINFIISPGFVSLGASIFFISFNSVQAGLNRRVCISLPLASSMVYFCLLLMFHWSASSEAPTPPSCWYHYSSYDCLCFSLSLYVIFCAPNASEHRSVHWHHMFALPGHVTRRNPACGIETHDLFLKKKKKRQRASTGWKNISMKRWLMAGEKSVVE